MTKKSTITDFLLSAKKKHGAKYDYSKVCFTSMSSKVVIICPLHGETVQTPRKHIVGLGCVACGFDARGGGRRMGAAAIYQQLVASDFGKKYTYPLWDQENVTRTLSKITAECCVHGPFPTTPHSLMSKGRGCPACGRVKTIAAHEIGISGFLERAVAVHGDRYDYSRVDYRGVNIPVEIICKVHGVFRQTLASHHFQKSGCPACARLLPSPQTTPLPYPEFLTRARAAWGDLYGYVESSYTRISAKVDVVCKAHGQFSQLASDHTGGHGCSICSSTGASRPQLEIAEYLRGFGEEVEIDFIYGDSRREVDVYLPKHNLAIEYHGLFWHSSQFKRPTAHLMKRRDVERRGIRLIEFFSDEWENKKQACQAILLNAIGALKGEVGGARTLTVVPVGTQDADAFYQTHHIQGPSRGTTFGLYSGMDPVIMMTFSKMHSARSVSEADSWELVRMASTRPVAGGASRLFRHLVKATEAKSVVSYSDNRIFLGGVYEKLGFSKAHVSLPDYRYVAKGAGSRMHKSSFQRKYLPKMFGDRFDPLLSESKNCAANGLYKVHDCGLTKWVWDT